MERLNELELKRKQLKELRERRSVDPSESIIEHVLQAIRKENELRTRVADSKESISAQVNDLVRQDNDNSLPGSQNEVITYDRAIQTSALVVEDIQSPKVQQDVLGATEEGRKDAASKILKGDKLVVPLSKLVVESQHNSIRSKSFSLQEVLTGTFPEKKRSQNSESSSKIHFIDKWCLDIDPPSGTKLKCVSLDYHEDLFIAVFQSVPEDNFNILLIPWSHVIVFRWDTDQLVDRVDFRGQILTEALFLRKYVDSNVTTILITSQTGKTMLYELRCVADDTLSKRIERNIISKNVFFCPIHAVEEYTDVPIGYERFIAVGTNGVLNEFRTLDLSIYADSASNKQPLADIRVVPPRPSELVDFSEDSDESEAAQKQEPAQLAASLFTNYLSKVALYDRLAITAISISPADPNCIYVGTEEGGIYKLFLDAVVAKTLKVHLDNNGFMPITKGSMLDDESAHMFHSGHVISLTHNKDGLLMSSSLDWTCKLWDPSQNAHVATIDLGSPVVDAQWLDEESQVCGILTWDSFNILKWNYHPVINSKTLVRHWECESPPKIIHKLLVQDPLCDIFTCFKTFKQGKGNRLLALGSNHQEIRFYRLPRAS